MPCQISSKGLATFLCLLVQIAFIFDASAKDVQLDYNGLEMKGYLEVATNKSMANDGVVVIIHPTLSHAREQYISDLQQLLKDQGVNSLAVNLTLGLDAREGNYNCQIEQNHRHKDGAEEIGAWVEWLNKQGVKKITLLGIERGGNQASLYIHEQIKLKLEEEEAIKKAKKRKRRRRSKRIPAKIYLDSISRLVMVMPLNMTAQGAYEDFAQRFRQDLRRYTASAQKFVEKKQEQELLEGVPFLLCGQSRVTVAAFLDYYQPKKEYEMFSYISDFPFPALALVGSRDPQFQKFEAVVSTQIENGVGQLGVARLTGLNRNYYDIPADVLTEQVVSFIKR